MNVPGAKPAFLIPPRARLRDWVTGGACAGTLLGLCEHVVGASSATGAPSLALWLVGTNATLVALGSGLLGAAARRSGVRHSRSAMVGAILGVQLFVAIAVGLLPLPGATDTAWARTGAALALGAALSMAAGSVSAQLADRSERAGTPASAPLLWGGCALLVAIGEGLVAVRPSWGSPAERLAMAGLAVVAASAALAAFRFSRTRVSRPCRPLGHILAVLLLWAFALSFAEQVLPWLRFDRDSGPPGSGAASILYVSLAEAAADRSGDADGATAPVIESLAVTGIAYPGLQVEARLGAAAPLLMRGGEPLVPRLRGLGYATAQIVTDPGVSLRLGTEQLLGRPHEAHLLRHSAVWATGARALLIGEAWLGSSRTAPSSDVTRSARSVGAEAERWLMNWRNRRSAAPFFLAVDFRARAPEGHGLEDIDLAIGRLLDALVQLEADETTLIVVAREGPGASDLRVLLRAPPVWRETPRGVEATRRVSSAELGRALYAAATAPAGGRVELPAAPVRPRAREGPGVKPGDASTRRREGVEDRAPATSGQGA